MFRLSTTRAVHDAIRKHGQTFHKSYVVTSSSVNVPFTTASYDPATDTTNTQHSIPDISFYQYAICPFCNINKALLAYANTPYTTQEVNPLTKAEIQFSKDYKKVPIAIINGTQINDSKNINDALLNLPYILQQLSEKNDLPLETFKDSSTAKRWETFARDELAPILYPNICRSLADSYEAFGYVRDVRGFTDVQKVLIRGVGSLAMYFAASKIKSKRNIKDERDVLRKALSQWEEEGLMNGERLFGSGSHVPDMGDLSVFGVLKSVSGLKTHREVILENDGVVKDWYHRMENEICSNDKYKK